MRNPAVCLILLFVFHGFVSVGFSQNQSAEFIESSSPLPGGGRVVSTSTPGSQIQTVATVPTTAQNALEDSRSVLDQRETADNRNSVFRQSASVNEAAAAVPRYPYPGGAGAGNLNAAANSVPRIAQNSLIQPAVRATRTCNNCDVPFQLPTLGLSRTAARQSFGSNPCCVPTTQAGSGSRLQVPAFQAPVLQFTPPANQVPTLPGPGVAPIAGNGFQTPFATNPNVGLPQFGNPVASQSGRFITPFLTGSGAYQPVIRLANLQPGTYLGQGIIGQPTAYVDGQPIRNLFRYIAP